MFNKKATKREAKRVYKALKTDKVRLFLLHIPVSHVEPSRYSVILKYRGIDCDDHYIIKQDIKGK